MPIISVTRIAGLLTIATLFSSSANAALLALPNGWYDDQLPIPVLHVEGSLEDVVPAHGALLKQKPELKKTLLYYANQVDERLSAQPLLKAHPLLKQVVEKLYRYFIRNPIVRHTPAKYLKAYRLFAQEADVDYDKVLDALVLPDAALRMVSLLYKYEPAPVLAPQLGCTSVIWDSSPAGALHGRNLDYEGAGFWDRSPLIMHVIPKEGLAYVAITSAGIQAPGITAFNEAGLTLSIHQLTFNNAQSSGTPLAVISAEIISNARTIDDAIAIIRSFPRAGGWAYVLSKGHDHAVIEASPTDVAVRRSSEQFFYQTNHVSSPALSVQQIFYTPGSWLDSFIRADRLASLKESSLVKKSWATPLKMVQILSDRSRIAGATIAKLDNVQSVVMDAMNHTLWTAISSDDKAPNENLYVEYHWRNLRQPDPPFFTGEKIQAASMTALSQHSQEFRALLRQAVKATTSKSERMEFLRKYFEKVQKNTSTTLASEEVWPGLLLWTWYSLKTDNPSADTALSALTALDWARANLLHFSKTLKAKQNNLKTFYDYRLMQVALYRGRVLDLLERRSEALLEYYQVSRRTGFERLLKAAREQLRTPYRWRNTQKISLDWAGIDIFKN